jgi:hypothetical protein
MAAFLKQPQAIDVAVKGIRGLEVEATTFVSTHLVATLQLLSEIPLVESAQVFLQPGREVKVTVTLPTEIKADVEFTHIAVALLLEEDERTPPTQSKQRSEVSSNGEVPRTYDVSVNAPPTPSNISIRLADGDPLWFHGGALSAQRYDLPDLAGPVNDYLDGVQTQTGIVNVPIKLDFLITSGSIGKAKIAIYALKYIRLKTESWVNDLDNTVRLDRNFSLRFAQTETIPLTPIDDASNLELRTIHFDCNGEFGPERLLGRISHHDGREFSTISPDFTVAQSILLQAPLPSVQCVGLSMLFCQEAEAEVYVAIRDDANGSPAAEALAQSTSSMPAPDPNAPPAWTFLRFDAPVQLRVDVPYWIVLKGVQGQLPLAMQAQSDTYLATTLVNRGGQLWRPINTREPRSLPLIRLVYLPDIDTQSAAVTFSVQDTSIRRPFDPAPVAQTISLQSLDDAALPTSVSIVIEAQAQGTLSLANVLQQYEAQS